MGTGILTGGSANDVCVVAPPVGFIMSVLAANLIAVQNEPAYLRQCAFEDAVTQGILLEGETLPKETSITYLERLLDVNRYRVSIPEREVPIPLGDPLGEPIVPAVVADKFYRAGRFIGRSAAWVFLMAGVWVVLVAGIVYVLSALWAASVVSDWLGFMRNA